jgi:hypothetical protein
MWFMIFTNLYHFQQFWIFPWNLITHQETFISWQLPNIETDKVNLTLGKVNFIEIYSFLDYININYTDSNIILLY